MGSEGTFSNNQAALLSRGSVYLLIYHSTCNLAHTSTAINVSESNTKFMLSVNVRRAVIKLCYPTISKSVPLSIVPH